jgi:hypothetical protein
LPLESAALSAAGAFAPFAASCPEFDPVDEPLAGCEGAEAVPLVFPDDPELAEPELLLPAEPASEPAAGLEAFFLVSRGGSSPLLPSPTGTSSALRVVFGASAPFGK